MKRFLFAVVMAAMLSFSGCLHQSGNDPAIENWKVVTEITVTCEQNGEVTRRIYTDQAKMQLILNGIRQLGQKFKPEVDPDALQLRTYCITLTHSDGSQRIYSTKGDRYIRQWSQPWQQADPEKVSDLNLLLQSLPGDVDVSLRRQGIPRR